MKLKSFSILWLTVLCSGFWGFPGTANAVSLDKFKLNGFFDLEYEKADGPVGDEKGSFDQVHFNLLMEFPVSDKVIVKGHLEFEHGPTMEDMLGDIAVEWAYVEYLLNNNMRFRAGKAMTPFGIYNEIHDATVTFLSVRTPWAIYRSDKVGGEVMFPKLSTGLYALGNYTIMGDKDLSYVVYVSNGEQDTANPAEEDQNSNKAVGGRIMVSPLPDLVVGGSYYTGKKQTGPSTQEDHSAWVGSVEYVPYPFGARAEYASSEIGDITQNGWYGEVSYAIAKFTPYLRYGLFDPDDNTSDDQWTELVYGSDYQIQQNFVLKLEYRQFGGESGNPTVSQDYNEYAAALTVAF